jgi:hypothetical protein
MPHAFSMPRECRGPLLRPYPSISRQNSYIYTSYPSRTTVFRLEDRSLSGTQTFVSATGLHPCG